MIGAIIGDIVGSRFEFDDNNIKPKEFEFFHEDCEWTDGSLMTVAVAAALMKWSDDGGDSDTTAAIAGSVAEAYWGVPKELAAKAEPYLEPEMVEVLKKFQLRHYGNIIG
jgi:ADP-ribosylglycohydrolase